MNIIELNNSNWLSLLERPTKSVEDIENTVDQIFKDVSANGDVAIKRYTSIFDGAILENMQITQQDIDDASLVVSSELKGAIELAKSNITAFHCAQKTNKICVETVPGVLCWQEKKAIDKIGLYIPGGTAPLFSSVLMLAIPAQLAGCKELVLCSPPDKNGQINPVILYAAQLCGVTKIYKIGGIQAIAAMTFGTEIVPKVSKIFGPGNQFVTAAKQLATKHEVAIDMPAGPSELLVVADESSNPAFVASDLLSQAEHGADSQVILVADTIKVINNVLVEVEKQTNKLPRKDVVKKALESSRAILIKNSNIALRFINDYAPEHLIISTRNDDFFIEGITNAGSVFIGAYTPESAGDYASGTNHTLPTNGYSKMYSGVNLDSFTKSITFQKISKKGIRHIGNAIELMADAEGLQAHKNAITLRLNSLKS